MNKIIENSIYKVLDLGDITDKYENVFIGGDIHGMYDMFMKGLHDVGFVKEKDLFIACGDLVDRGPKNKECIDLLNEDWFISAKGNHDRMVERYVSNPSNIDFKEFWEEQGGRWNIKYGLEEMSNMANLIHDKMPLVVKFVRHGKRYMVAHANIYDPEDLSSYDERFITQDRTIHHNGHTSIPGYEFCFFGHTYNEDLSIDGNRVYIDTGAVFGKKFTFVRMYKDQVDSSYIFEYD